jgi:hypothetical protein
MSVSTHSDLGPDMRLVQEDEVDAVSGGAAGVLVAVGVLVLLFEAGFIAGCIIADETQPHAPPPQRETGNRV